jgi:hypothetical protein
MLEARALAGELFVKKCGGGGNKMSRNELQDK